MSPHETLFLENTNTVRIKEINNNQLVHLQILDFPGNYSFADAAGNDAGDADKLEGGLDPDKVFSKAGALVFVIDGQDEESYSEAIDYFLHLAKLAYKSNNRLSYDVLIHKIDGDSYLSDDLKIDCRRDIQSIITDELADANLPIHPSFYLTSIYDHSIFEAFSKITQSQIPQLPFLENLLDSLIASCGIDKAFLFDVVSKIYVATDSNPVDMATYELCSDMIDVVIDVSCIYGLKGKGDALAYDADSASVIKLSNDYILYLREVNRYLALVCLMRTDSYAKSGLVEYNVACFKDAMSQLFEAKSKFTAKGNSTSSKSTSANTKSTRADSSHDQKADN
eukprot:TRINITY_DN63158_c0_g1_i1.p1 TRINITY_DN63158_c0_g1~~TRINITY_DN63158_c0_g1_i1.p1  ORF type:complete len:338 (-),score=200.03 TRINITY_DN63158_c0_g1_i1:37-1050(-)